MKRKDGWFKPFSLNRQNIEQIVPDKAGVYVLGDFGEDHKVKVRQIRLSENVKNDLLKNVGKFQVFMFKPAKPHTEDHQQTLQFA
jgi:hypothetical protein